MQSAGRGQMDGRSTTSGETQREDSFEYTQNEDSDTDGSVCDEGFVIIGQKTHGEARIEAGPSKHDETEKIKSLEEDPVAEAFRKRLELSLKAKAGRVEKPIEKCDHCDRIRFHSYSIPGSKPPLNPQAAPFVPERLRTSPFTCVVEYDKKHAGDLCGAFQPALTWDTAIRSPQLREHITKLYQTPLPLQQFALPVINTRMVDGMFVCPSGHGRTTTWMIAVIDLILMRWMSTYAGTVNIVILVPSEAKAADVKEEMYVHIPRFENGKPRFLVDTMHRRNVDDIALKVNNDGARIIITTPYLLATSPFVSYASFRMIFVDEYENIDREQIEDGIFNYIFDERIDKEKRHEVKTTVLSSVAHTDFPFRKQCVVHTKTTLQATEAPRLDFVYIKSDKDAYEELKYRIDRCRKGTRIVYVNGYTRQMWEDLPQDMPRLRFGFLTYETPPPERVEFMKQYREGAFDVVVAGHSEHRFLESSHRAVDIHYVIPRRLQEFADRLNQRNRIFRGDSVIFLDCENIDAISTLMRCVEDAGQDNQQLEKIRTRMYRDLEEKDRRRKEAARRDEDRYDHRDQRYERHDEYSSSRRYD